MLKKYPLILVTLIAIVTAAFLLYGCTFHWGGDADGDGGGDPQAQGGPEHTLMPRDDSMVDYITDEIAAALAAGGGVVNIPAGEYGLGNEVFGVPGGVRVIGAGRSETVLYDAIFHFDSDHFGSAGDGICQLSSLSIINHPTEGNYYFNVRRVNGMRMDNLYISGRYSTFCNVNSYNFMLVDNCEFNLYTSYGFYVFDDNSYYDNMPASYSATGKIGDSPAVQELLVKKTNKNTTFVEDCVFRGRFDHLMDARSGGHWVFRHNLVSYEAPPDGSASGPLEGHGPTDPNNTSEDLNTGTNCIELHDVEITEDQQSGSAGVLIRSGIAIICNSTIRNKGAGVAMGVEGSPYNWIDHPGGYPFYNQPHGIWIWGMTYESIENNQFVTTVWNSEDHILENRDYFLREPTMAEDGFVYVPHEYPHPYRSNFPPNL